MDEVDRACIRLLGGFALEGRSPVALRAARLQALLAHLVVHPGVSFGRSALAFSWWPDSSEAQALTNLRHALHHLRRELPDVDRLLWADRREVRWIGSVSCCDVSWFEVWARRALRSGKAGDLAVAAEAYGGDLLPESYDERVIAARARLRELFGEVLGAAVSAAEADGRMADAIRFAELAAQTDPLDELVHRRPACVLLVAGERARALRVLRTCADRVRGDLGVDPGSETLVLISTIAGRALVDRAGAVPPTRMIGRGEAWESALACATDAERGSCRVLLIGGDPGIGKTRLARDLVAELGRHGWATGIGRAHEAEGLLPYAALVDVLSAETLRSAAAVLEPSNQALLARLVPVTASGGDDAGPVAEMSQRTALFDAVVALVRRVGRPLALLIDDLPWCDEGTLRLLHYVVRKAGVALLLVATARTGPSSRPPAIERLMASLLAEGVAVDLVLDPLDDGAAAEVVATVRRLPFGHRQVADVVAAARGNPFFLVELARSAWEPGQDPPSSIRSMLQARLGHLSAHARAIAEVGALLALPFDERFVNAVLPDIAAMDVADALDELWRQRILVDDAAGDYAFVHDVVRETVAGAIAPARRRSLHARLGEALATSDGGSGHERAGLIASHYERGGRPGDAVLFHAAAAEAARRALAFEHVIVHARRGLAQLGRLPAGHDRDEIELRLLLPLGAAIYGGPGLYPDDTAVYERSRALCESLGRPVDPSTLRILANVANGRRDFRETHRTGRRLLTRGRTDREPILTAEAHYALGVASCWLGRRHTSERHLRRALASYRGDRARQHVERFGHDVGAICTVRLAFSRLHAGDDDEALRLGAVADGLARRVGHGYTEAYVNVFRIWIAVERGDHETASGLLPAVVAAAPQNVWIGQMARLYEGWRAGCVGDTQTALRLLGEAVIEARQPRHQMMEPHVLATAARAHAVWGDPSTGLELVDRLVTIAARDMPFHVPEALLERASLRHLSGAPLGAVHDGLRLAATVADRQGSVLVARRARARLRDGS